MHRNRAVPRYALKWTAALAVALGAGALFADGPLTGTLFLAGAAVGTTVTLANHRFADGPAGIVMLAIPGIFVVWGISFWLSETELLLIGVGLFGSVATVGGVERVHAGDLP